jgi:hypothetical protein
LNHHQDIAMRTQSLPLCILPANLSDESAVELLDCLREITRVLEEHYAQALNPEPPCLESRQQSLWTDDEPPF